MSIEHKVKSKIGTIFENEDILEEYSARIYEIDLYLSKHYKEIQVDDNGQQYILFKIDICFTKYCLAVEIDEKGHTDRDLEFEEKRQKALEKKLNCPFIRINTSKENFNVDHQTSRIKTFISQFKDNKRKEKDKEIREKDNEIKEKDNKSKRLEDEIKKLKLKLANLDVKNNDVNDKK